ncbi:MAG: four helix bundle protein [Chitinophagaceae bacterium]|nr:four helix bundle protein [Chitinophagaceae bacterium]
MATFKQFEELPVWKDARLLAKKIKSATQKDLFQKDYKFVSQITAAAGSVMDNIAEGFERGSQFEFVNHLSYAKGSAGEVRSQLYRAFDFDYITETEKNQLVTAYETLSSHIANFMSYLNQSEIKGKKFEGRANQSSNNK